MAIPQKSDPNHRKYKRATRRHRTQQRNLAQKDNKFKGYYHKPGTAYVRNKKRVDFELG